MIEFNSDGEKAVEDTVEGVLKQETEQTFSLEEAVKLPESGPPVKRAKKLPAKKVKVEEAKPPFDLPKQETVFVPAFSIVEESNVEVVKPEIEVVSETEAEQTKDTPAPQAAKQVTPLVHKRMLKQLRANDPPTKRTCAACMRRVPLAEINGGLGEVCDKCK